MASRMRDVARRARRPGAAAGPHRRRVARVHPGAPPGTLVAVEAAPPTRITVLSWTRAAATFEEVADADAALARVAPGALTWINVDGLGDVGTLAKLGERFGLHPLALEDVLNVPQRAKVERYDQHMFVVMRTMRLTEGAVQEEQVSLFFGDHWLITVQERSDGDCFGPVRDAIRAGRGRVREAAADYVAYLLLDAVVDAYFPIIENVGERMQAQEAAAIENPNELVLRDMQRMRHELLALRRAVWPMREELGILVRDETALVSAETRVFLRDVYDHAVQALEIVESLRETAVSVMEVYLSVQNRRLNEVMKVLTVIATIFIPLTFIASIYGMNFRHMPELEWRYGYAWALGLMALVATALVVYFRRRGWW
jgi:magnesium transporter